MKPRSGGALGRRLSQPGPAAGALAALEHLLREHSPMPRKEVVVGEERDPHLSRLVLPDRDRLHVVEFPPCGLDHGLAAVEPVLPEHETPDPSPEAEEREVAFEQVEPPV